VPPGTQRFRPIDISRIAALKEMEMKKALGVFTIVVLAAVALLAAGTSLSIVFSPTTVTCNGDGTANVTFDWTVTSTAAADAATVTGQVDGGTIFSLPGIAAGNVTNGGGWTFAGRMKTADGSYTTTLANGTHTFTVCATQAGSNGNPDKTACATTTVTVDCTSTSACANAEVFGEVPANRNLCLANGHIEIQFQGDFDDIASLKIDGPTGTGFTKTVYVDRAGNSCNYHYNWDPQDSDGNGGPGTYSFTVNGNSKTLTFGADLLCTVHGNPN
jgi:hypothetical protein